MKAEPLKGKGCSPIEDEITMEYDPLNPDWYDKEDIKSAVKWLKKEIDKTIKIREESISEYEEIHRLDLANAEEKCKEDLEWCKRKIDEAFEE